MLLECGARTKEQFEAVKKYISLTTVYQTGLYSLLVDALKDERERDLSIYYPPLVFFPNITHDGFFLSQQ